MRNERTHSGDHGVLYTEYRWLSSPQQASGHVSSLSLLAYFTHTVMRTRCMRRRAICTRTKNEAYFIARASPWKRPSNKFALILDYVNSDPVHTIPGIFKTKIMWEGL